jgi:hypothetical protein
MTLIQRGVSHSVMRGDSPDGHQAVSEEKAF